MALSKKAAANAAERGSLSSVEGVWNSVCLEERLELIASAQATGVIASLAALLLVGSIAYGFDQIWLLVAGVASSIFVFPLFSSYSWRRGKPALILAYLAVRAVGRRYAYGYHVDDLDIILIYRGQMKEVFADREQEELAKRTVGTEFEARVGEFRDVWIMLLRGAVVLLSEKAGGAKLEYLTHVTAETVLRDVGKVEDSADHALVVEGVGAAKGKIVMISSKYQGAHYVFRKQLAFLIEEAQAWALSQERLRQKTAA